MPKDINPMPPRTFRGGFLFVQTLKICNTGGQGELRIFRFRWRYTGTTVVSTTLY